MIPSSLSPVFIPVTRGSSERFPPWVLDWRLAGEAGRRPSTYTECYCV